MPGKPPPGTKGVGFICTRGGLHRCAFCVGSAVFQCDFPITTKKSGTCDAYLCRHHAQAKGGTVHWCPTHGQPRSVA